MVPAMSQLMMIETLIRLLFRCWVLLHDNPGFNPPAGWWDVNQYFWSATQSGENLHESVMLYVPGFVQSNEDGDYRPVVVRVLG